MESVLIGRSALTAGRIAYGCSRLIITLATGKLPSEGEAIGEKSIIAAYEAGYTLFDHADIYAGGEAERVFGKVLRKVSGMRDRVAIATKCGVRRQGDPAGDAPYRYDFSKGHIILSCEESLRRMNVETIDLYQLHRPDFLADPFEVAAAFDRLKRDGKVREFGVSNFRPSQVALLQKACEMRLVANQVEISLEKLDCFTDGTLDQCMMEGITPLAWAPLAAGRLASNDPIDLRDPNHAHRLQLRETLDRIARRHSRSRASVAVAWLLKHPAGIIPIVGSADPVKIRELAQAGDLHLTREEWYALMEAAYGHRLA